jgi:hypothetical protein
MSPLLMQCSGERSKANNATIPLVVPLVFDAKVCIVFGKYGVGQVARHLQSEVSDRWN